MLPVRHQHPTSSCWPKTPCTGPSPTRRAAHVPLRAHTGQLCLTRAQLKSEGRKVLTPCMVCIFNVSSFPSWRMSLSYQMPLCSLRGTQTNPDTRVPGRGLRTKKCAVRSRVGCSHSKCRRSSESRGSSRGGAGRKDPGAGPSGGEQRIEETSTGEENSNWDLYANPTEHKGWPGLDSGGRAPLAALSPADSRPPSAPPRPPNTGSTVPSLTTTPTRAVSIHTGLETGKSLAWGPSTSST